MKSTDKFVLVLVASLALLLAGCGGGSSTPPPDPGPTAGEMAIEQAQTALTNAQAAVSSDMTDMQMAAAYRAIENAANALVAALTTHGGSPDEIAAAASTGGEAKAMADSLDMKIAEAQKAADMEMMAVAAKLYDGITAQVGTVGTAAVNDRWAQYNTDATAIEVSVGLPADAPAAITLSEDKKTMVAANHGWAGKRYADPAGGDMVEAMVYSNVGAPTQGRKFGSAAAATADDREYEYQLDANDRDGNANKALSYVEAHAPLISLPSVTQTAGTKTFNLPDPNNGGAQYINEPGMLHGVSGTFSCEPATGTTSCTAAVAAKGFTLGGGTWLFIPSDANARVTDVPDADYASYGWWIHKSADGSTFTASAFVDEKGTVAGATGLNALNGTATYRGGAAGKYALSSSTGGTNDAGHFTARATLEANFSTNTDTDTTTNAITGTIDQFIGADGEARDWSVALMGSPIADTGGIGDASDTTAGNAPMTVWTIGDTAEAKSGEWTGTLRNNGTDGVPQVGTGTFYSTYGMDGKMVGAFGVNKE